MNSLLTAVLYPLDLAGIFAFALSGALLAVRKDFDFFGTLLLAEAAGTGGGLFRDLVLSLPPVAFTDTGYCLVPLVAAVVVFVVRPTRHLISATTLCDAGALGMFSVTGTVKALEHGSSPLPAVALGVTTAVGGGLACGVLAGEIPAVLRWDQDLYVLPALVGAGATAALDAAGRLDVAGAVCAAALALALRICALLRGWRTPRSALWKRYAQTAEARSTAPGHWTSTSSH
ncbi:TRIC cation channel family protein [Streptomyces sp. ISL-12]|uniref:trimeric intracellular cation channel family protein n=1 Tax=Streptomyces sp. ISL-12 TaxID=2819177 RepID=UPI001BE7EF33|nr:TRIC cation channel family protein [Streptomyces sp. ISL-12]MBT2414693.1 TRIC cation channel family protein [Streptomyces sp. ISL-12]